MDDFGQSDPREMPRHLFQGALRFDYRTAVRANAERQNCSICPRHWYVDVVFGCERCAAEFTFSAAEQRTWYEEYGFWIDAIPKYCLDCRRALRELKTVRQEYDRIVAEALEANDLTAKKRLAGIIDRLCELGGTLPPRILENRRRLANEIAKIGSDIR